MNSSVNVSLRNNILWAQGGYDVNVAPDSEVGFASDYNDLYTTAPGNLGLWEGRGFNSLPDWFYELGLDGHSLTVNPQFVAPAGADGILGFSNQTVGATHHPRRQQRHRGHLHRQLDAPSRPAATAAPTPRATRRPPTWRPTRSPA